MDEELLQKLIARAISYVSFRPRSGKEIHDYIVKRIKGDNEEYVSFAEARLKELGYIDDEAYVKMFIESRNRSRPKGKKLIQLELLQKGVSQEIIDSVSNDGPTDIELARVVAQKKHSPWRKLPILEQKKKLFGLLQRRGFASSVIFRIIDEMLGNQYNEDT
ncbi:MAG: regulatory protein RecX [Bacteroidota bacterium]